MHGGHSKYVLVLPKQNPGAVVLDTPLGPMGAPYGGPGLKVAPKSGGTGVVVTPISPLGPPQIGRAAPFLQLVQMFLTKYSKLKRTD